VQVGILIVLLTITNVTSAFLMHDQANLQQNAKLNQESLKLKLVDNKSPGEFQNLFSPSTSIISGRNDVQNQRNLGKRSARIVGYRQVDAYACSRRLSQLSCIMGCQRCTEVYGRRVYRMADCCVRCQVTQAAMVDDGPENCSLDFFNMEFLQWHSQR
jgi:hypothetical protein